MKKLFVLFLVLAASVGSLYAETIFSESFSSSQGNFTIENKQLPGDLTHVWQWRSAAYGIVASAYKNSTSYAAESWLISPSISLTGYSEATLSFDHACNKGVPDNFRIKISKDNGVSWNDLDISQWPAGTNWTFVSAAASLNAYVGNTIKIAFCYVSTTTICPQWEIKNFLVTNVSSLNLNYVKIRDLYYTLDTVNHTAEVKKDTINKYQNLSSAEIPTSITFGGVVYDVTSIGDSAFYNCSRLTSISIPNSVTGIGKEAFWNCSRLTSVTIPNSVTSIGGGAFTMCSGLTSVHISDLAAWCSIAFSSSFSNPLYHAKHLFINDTEVIDLIIPSSVTSIGSLAFCGCLGLLSVTIPNSVTSIGNYAFYKCSGLTSVIIPNSVTSIGLCAFEECSSLTSISIPNSVTSIGEDAFRGCSGLTSVTISDLAAWCNIAFSNYFANPIYYAKHLYINETEITNLEIPNSITIIGNYAFCNCSSLTSVTIPNSVTNIGGRAFSSCSSLTSVAIGNSVTSIGNYAFYNCSSLTSVTIPNSVTSIGSGAFSGCSGLTSIAIPNSVTCIGDTAFYKCTDLTSVTIPNGVTSIGYYTFEGCGKITSVVWNAKNCSRYNFGSQVTSFVFGDSVEVIPTSLCSGMNKLTSIIIPNSVTSIGEDAFRGCSGLTSVTIPNSVTSIGGRAFSSCSRLTSIEIPNSVTSIEHYMFEGCSALTSVEIPNSVTSIGYQAFYRCSGLTSVTIPKSVTSISYYAFGKCDSLQSVYNYATTPQVIESSVFSNINIGLCTLYVPEGSYNAYKSANVWKDFIINEMVSVETLFTSYKNDAITQCANMAEDGDSEACLQLIADAQAAIAALTYDENKSLEENYAMVDAIIANLQTALQEQRALQPQCVKIGDLYYNLYPATKTAEVTYEERNIGNDYSNLTSVAIPTTVTFDNVAYSVTSIGNSAFGKCFSLTSVIIGNSVTSIGSYAFWNCIALTSITIPNSVTSIGDHAFLYCSGLTNVTIGNSVTSIGNSAFSCCKGLTSVTIGNSVTSIGESAFDGCYGLTSLTIPNSVISIGDCAFSSCTGLTSIYIGNSVTNIGNCAFVGGSKSLTNIVVASDNATYDSRDNCNALIETATNKLITGCSNTIIPNSVTSIGEFAFYACTGLTSVVIPNSVTSIGENAFCVCFGLTSVVIPASVTSIGDNAFCVCKSLNSIYNYATTPQLLSADTFGGEEFVDEEGATYGPVDKSTCKLYVPEESISLYKAADVWKEFLNILPLGTEDIDHITIDQSKISNKILHNGQIYILRGDKTYNLQGQEVR